MLRRRPTTPAPTIVFSGTPATGTGLASGAHQIGLNLWRSADPSVAANQVCSGGAQSVTVTTGAFQVPLSTECVAALTRYSQVWYQLVMDGTSFPLVQIGAVPFAARSTQENGDAARLKTSRKSRYGEDGFHSTATGGLTDTTRNEECGFTNTNEGGIPLSSFVKMQEVAE